MPCLCKTANNEIDWVETMLGADNAGQFGGENLTNVASSCRVFDGQDFQMRLRLQKLLSGVV